MNLRRLAILSGDISLHQRAERLAGELGARAAAYPEAFCRYLMAEIWQERSAQLVVVAPDSAAIPEQDVLSWKQTFRPGLMILVVREGQSGLPPLAEGKGCIEGRVTGYLCRGNTCQEPSTDIPGLLRELDSLYKSA
nr:hypothetical protein [uncultured bacterium]